MPEALEWFQCRKCGRRQRWAAELAGKTLQCSCGASIECPKGADLNDASGRGRSFTDTLVESTDAPSAVSPYESLDPEYFEIQEVTALPPTIEEVRSTKAFYIWTGGMLFGLAMLIHAIITQWPVYIVLASLFVPITFWKFYKSKRRWQKGRPFSQALARSLGMDRN